MELFNLLESLQACQGLLVKFGGHAQACGLTVNLKHLEEFQAFVNHRAKLVLGREGLLKTHLSDLELPLEAIVPRWVEETERFSPFGRGNPRPTVVVRHLTIEMTSPRIGVLSDGTRRVLARGRFPVVVQGGRYDVLASPALTEGKVVLMVSDVKVSTAPWGLAQTSGTRCTHGPA